MQAWYKDGETYSQTSPSAEIYKGELPVGIYKIEHTMMGYRLARLKERFEFNYKLYDIETEFIDHVLQWWSETNRNLGVLLSGTKGTGKSVTAKIISNAVKLPVILIDDNDEDLIRFLTTFDFPCVFFFDEYEKLFKDGNQILTLMDGAFSDFNRKLFILTTNSFKINENLISRPSRIRYHKEFYNLSIDVISNYIDDNLKRPERKHDILKFLNELSECTIDIIKAIVQEINMFNSSIEEIQDYMNLDTRMFTYHCYKFDNDYQNKEDQITNIDDFIALCKRIGTSGKDIQGVQKDYLMYNDLGLTTSYSDFIYKFSDLEVGDNPFSNNDSWDILAIKDNAFLVAPHYNPEDINDWQFFYIKDPNEDKGLYDGKLDLIL